MAEIETRQQPSYQLPSTLYEIGDMFAPERVALGDAWEKVSREIRRYRRRFRSPTQDFYSSGDADSCMIPSRIVPGKMIGFYAEPNGLKYLSTDFSWVSFYYLNEEGRWHLEEMESSRGGYGKRVLRELSSHLGPDQHVSAAIIERYTKAMLARLGYFRRVWQTQAEVRVTENDLDKLKIVRLFRGGGIAVESLVVGADFGADNRWDYFCVHLRGRTMRV